MVDEKQIKQNGRLLSIILPVYNAETYIKQCLDSLLEQDTEQEKYEIICINDGSTDDSLRILEEYAKKYDNIRLIDKQNEGVSVARNLGLEKACGEYVWFVDADDWIARNCLSAITEEILRRQPSVFLLEYKPVVGEEIKKYESNELRKDEIKVTEGVPFYVCAVCMAIIKRELVSRFQLRFFENITYGEDTLFMRDLLDGLDIENEKKGIKHLKLAYRGPAVYFYRQNDKSVTNTAWGENRLKYMKSLLERARINGERMKALDKPKWYTDQYKALYRMRIFDYMMFWLPGSGLDVKKTIKELREKKIWPCKIRAKISKETPQGLKEKLVSFYREIAFENRWLYIRYHRQMEKKYKKSDAH